jgi:hypothetical protein
MWSKDMFGYLVWTMDLPILNLCSEIERGHALELENALYQHYQSTCPPSHQKKKKKIYLPTKVSFDIIYTTKSQTPCLVIKIKDGLVSPIQQLVPTLSLWLIIILGLTLKKSST